MRTTRPVPQISALPWCCLVCTADAKSREGTRAMWGTVAGIAGKGAGFAGQGITKAVNAASYVGEVRRSAVLLYQYQVYFALLQQYCCNAQHLDTARGRNPARWGW